MWFKQPDGSYINLDNVRLRAVTENPGQPNETSHITVWNPQWSSPPVIVSVEYATHAEAQAALDELVAGLPGQEVVQAPAPVTDEEQ
jgi:hypothetical protein